MFLNRIHAGNELVKTIPISIKQGTIVLAIPRGGVIIGHQIAQHFNLQLDVVVFLLRNPGAGMCLKTDDVLAVDREIPTKTGAPPGAEREILVDGRLVWSGVQIRVRRHSGDFIREQRVRVERLAKRQVREEIGLTRRDRGTARRCLRAVPGR